jgi:hypothetical protein
MLIPTNEMSELLLKLEHDAGSITEQEWRTLVPRQAIDVGVYKADANIWPLAHEAAMTGKLPAGFSDWGIVCAINGLTVAHTAAIHNTLPEGFSLWNLYSEKGPARVEFPVASITLAVRCPGYFEFFERQRLQQGFGKDIFELPLILPDGPILSTVAHLYVNRATLPADVDLWHLRNYRGVTVAHRAALAKTLPKDFSHWEWVDDQGRSVRDYLEVAKVRDT